MAHEYALLDWITLEAGSWADWASGSMSALAVIVALSAYPLANRQKRAEQRERDVELARSVGWKLIRILNYTDDIDRHFRVSLAAGRPRFPPGYKFPLVRPLGVPDKPAPELNQSEIDFLLKSQSADLLMEIDMCSGRYASLVYSMGQYKARHEALFELMPPPIQNDGALFTHSLSPEENARVKPYATMLELLLEGAMALSNENLEKCKSAIQQYTEHMTRYFGKPVLSFSTDEAVASEGREAQN